jgi:hypothetical protein
LTAPPLTGVSIVNELPPRPAFPGAEQEERADGLVGLHLPGFLHAEPPEAGRRVLELLEPGPSADRDRSRCRNVHRSEDDRAAARLRDDVERLREELVRPLAERRGEERPGGGLACAGIGHAGDLPDRPGEVAPDHEPELLACSTVERHQPTVSPSDDTIPCAVSSP